MSATDTEVREALAVALKAVDGLRPHAYVPAAISPPAAVVTEVDVDFDAAMGRASDEMTVRMRLLASGELRAAQLNLSALTYAIRTALWENPTLGDVVSDCRLRRRIGESEGQVDVGGATYTVVDLEVQVVT